MDKNVDFDSYDINLTVFAAKILDVNPKSPPQGRTIITLENQDGEVFKRPVYDQFMEFFGPKVGDYFIVCEDGLCLCLSKDSFTNALTIVDLLSTDLKTPTDE